MKNIYFDIETIPSQLDWVKQDLRAKIKPPANIKKQESVDKWYEEKLDDAFEEKYDKLALDGAYNHVVCVGVAINNDEPVTFSAASYEDEKTAIQDFIQYIEKHTDEHERRFVGHNVIGFDLSVLKKRCYALGINPSVFPLNAKPWESNPYDTMTRWDAKSFIGLNALVQVLGLPVGKTDGFSGADVYKAWKKGEHERIAEYCKNDVVVTRAAGRTMMKLEGIL